MIEALKLRLHCEPAEGSWLLFNEGSLPASVEPFFDVHDVADPVPKLDFEDLQQFMATEGARYSVSTTRYGSVFLKADGNDADRLFRWLERVLGSGVRRRR